MRYRNIKRENKPSKIPVLLPLQVEGLNLRLSKNETLYRKL